MKVTRKISNWLSRHWQVIRDKPVNGKHAAREIGPILKEMRKNNKRVNNAVEKLKEDTANIQRMVADATASSNDSSS